MAELRDLTVTEYGERWLRESASRLKPRTLRSYTGLFRRHVVGVDNEVVLGRQLVLDSIEALQIVGTISVPPLDKSVSALCVHLV